MSIKSDLEEAAREAAQTVSLARMDEYDCSIADYERIYLEGANEARKFIIRMGRAMANEIPSDAGVFEMGQADGIRWLCDRIAAFEEDL